MAESTVIKLNLMNCCHMIFTRPDFHLIKSNQAGSRRWYASFDDGKANNSATEIAFCAINLVSQNCVFRLFILSGVFYEHPPPPLPGTKLAMTCDTFIILACNVNLIFRLIQLYVNDDDSNNDSSVLSFAVRITDRPSKLLRDRNFQLTTVT